MIDRQLLENLEALQRGERITKIAQEELVVHSLAVTNNGTCTVSWVGRIALECYRTGQGARSFAA